MSSAPKKRAPESNFFLEYPGVTATIFAMGVVAAFLGALLGPALSEKGEHKAAEPPAAGAPAAK